MSKFNILYLHSHDTGRYIQPYGYQVPTPNLQKLAEEGVLFRQCYCANPTCSPSRACLLTGQYAHSNGMFGLSHRGFSLNDYSQHIIHTLKGEGYFCALSGVQHIDGPAEDVSQYASQIGYDAVLGRDAMKSKWDSSQAEHNAVEFLHDSPQEPFFLSVGFHQTHRGFPAHSPEDDPRYCMPPPGIVDTQETRDEWAGFQTSARTLDRRMGMVLQALEDSGLASHTLVICTTDHGIAYPRMKCNLTDDGIGVFLIMRGPHGLAGGRVIDELVSHIDIFPTVCELLRIEPPEWLQGTSMMPLFQNPSTSIRDEVFAEVNYHGSYEPQRCIRTKRWKYICRYNDKHRTPVLPNCDDSPSKSLWLAHGWDKQTIPEEQLYDLLFDPLETNNLFEVPQYADVLTDMRERLKTWMVETEDPLLAGPVAAPPGAVMNDPNHTSPKDPFIDARPE